ncbi:MAG TPA: 50S ribosomal protein L25/general stress protein Ctc [Alphaproteobacteria bacterium]|nr:50S ribosomal protein L25/general stress protein Ctc [Alphaproteobacteria bacterium]
MADAMILNAERRERAGKGAARAARRAGRVPGVIYGSKKTPENISIDPRELMIELRKPGFFTNLYDVKLDGASQQVLVRDVQLHPVTDRPVHVDLLRVDPNTKVTVEVPVVFENEAASPGLKRGGVLNVVRHTIEVVCFATQIPHEIRVDLTGLDIGDSVHISRIGLPEGVRPTIARDFTVASVAAPTTMAAEAEAAAATETPAAVEVITAKKPEEGVEAGAEKGKEAKGKGKE